MYQAFLFTMLLALTANNTGVMWVAVEAATLTTVLMVSLYRTREAIEAAWKYFILCSVGIGLALFGTTLVYLAAQPVMGDGADAMAWTLMIGQAHRFQPDLLNLAFVFVLVGYGTKAWPPCTPGCPTPTRKAPPPSRRCCRGCCSTWRSTPCCASRC
jgi:hydrogenase-4 component F